MCCPHAVHNSKTSPISNLFPNSKVWTQHIFQRHLPSYPWPTWMCHKFFYAIYVSDVECSITILSFLRAGWPKGLRSCIQHAPMTFMSHLCFLIQFIENMSCWIIHQFDTNLSFIANFFLESIFLFVLNVLLGIHLLRKWGSVLLVSNSMQVNNNLDWSYFLLTHNSE